MLEADEKVVFNTPFSQVEFPAYFNTDPMNEIGKIRHLFVSPLVESSSSSDSWIIVFYYK